MPKAVKPQKKPTQNGPLTIELLGQHIKAKRTQLGIGLEDAALLCNVAKETLSKIESARSGVRFETVLHVCKMLGLELIMKDWEEKHAGE